MVHVAVARLRVGAKKMISASRQSLVTLGKAGGVWSFGRYGCDALLGHGVGKDSSRWGELPRLIKTLDRMVVVQVAAGNRYSIALTRGGGVFAWGSEYDPRNRYEPWRENAQRYSYQFPNEPMRVRLEGGKQFTNVTDISAGAHHCLAVGKGGAVYAWGWKDCVHGGKGSCIHSHLGLGQS